MPAATTKADLKAVTEAEWGKLVATLETVPDQAALAKDDEDVSIKDVVGHRAHWIALFLGWYRVGQAGEEVQLPAPGYTWGELKRYNADLRAAQADLGWEAARTLLAARHAALLTFIDALDEDALYGAPMPGGRNAWTTGRWAEAAGPSHYRSANKYIRGRLRAMARTE